MPYGGPGTQRLYVLYTSAEPCKTCGEQVHFRIHFTSYTLYICPVCGEHLKRKHRFVNKYYERTWERRNNQCIQYHKGRCIKRQDVCLKCNKKVWNADDKG